ncbi:MAG: hypothetical protein OEV42_15545 [Deltaproteobacteria bacterium]|nr:hypothetical protein [Deltaproteobacteria bacterium]
MTKTHKLQTYLAIYLISTATLTYEIGLTRLFSLSQGYHFAFMVLSIALLGIGAGGSILFLWKGSEKMETSTLLSVLASLFAILSVLSFILSNHILFDPVKAAWDKGEFIKIFYQYLILSLPFILSGMIISAAIRAESANVHRIYFSDLAGAGTGCLVILGVLSFYGGERAVIISSLLALSSAFLFIKRWSIRNALFPLFSLLILLSMMFSPYDLLELKLSPYREISSILKFPGAKRLDRIFSPAGEIDIVESPVVRAAPGISLNYTSPLPKQMGFTLNGGGLMTVSDRKGNLSFLSHLPSSLPYKIAEGGHVFVVDAGGGMELLSALQNGASSVTGSENSSIIIEAMTGSLAPFSGHIYKEANIIYGPARNILKGLDLKFDIIQVPLTGTLGSSSSGILGLQEDYRLTVEAIKDYMLYLKDDGILAFSLYLLPPPRQEVKLFSTIVTALEERGISHADNSIAAVRSWGVMTILVKKGGFLEEDIKAIKKFSHEESFDLVWYAGMKEGEANMNNRFHEPLYYRLFVQIFDKGLRGDLYKNYLFNVAPARDDRPFFGHTFKMTRMKETYESVGKKWGVLIEGGYLLPWILIQSAIASFILIVTPLIFMKKGREKIPGLFPLALYFAAIGIAFMFVEIALIQRLIPVLGEGVYAISAVLFSLLISTGVGSYLSGRFEIIRKYSAGIILLLALLVLFYLFVLPKAVEVMAVFSLGGKYVMTFFLLAPLGIFMGIPFPTGMWLIGKSEERLIPWAWCINGSFSVISSVLAMLIALNFGFNSLQIFAAFCYAIACLALIRLRGLFLL